MDLRMTLEVELDERYTIPRPPISWKPQTRSLAEVIRNFDLPQVVQCDVKDCPISVYNVNFDLTQPLLLCLNRTIRKICARNLTVDKKEKALREVGEPVLIPRDYKGWFAVLKDGLKVPHFGSIAAIATSRVCRFLVTTKLVGFYILSDRDGSMTYARRELLPGDLLRAGKVYVGSSKGTRDFGLFKKKKKKDVEVKFLKCTDDTDREILINLNQTGTFYPISYTNGSVTGCVMQLSDILNKLHFPLDVKLVYGRIPNAPCSFSGMLRLTASFEEDTVVAATIMNYKNILLELSTQSLLLFKVAYATRQLLESKAYQQALEMCQERAEVYVRDIKVSFDFVTDTTLSVAEKEQNSTANNGNTQLPSSEIVLPVHREATHRSSKIQTLESEEPDRYIDTSRSASLPANTSLPSQNGSEYEMIWHTSSQNVKKRQKEDRTDSDERRASFRLSLEGTYLSCPIFSTDDRMKQTAMEENCDSDQSSTSAASAKCSEEPRELAPPPLPPRIPRPKSKVINSAVNGTVQLEPQNIYEVLKRTQPVEKALHFQDHRGSHVGSVASGSSTGSDRTSVTSGTNYENSSTNTSVGDNMVELSDLDEDLRDYDFPEPYLLHKPSDSDYSPVDEAPSCLEGSLPPADVVSYYDSGSYRPISPGESVDDLPLGASCSHVGGFIPQCGTSGHTVIPRSSEALASKDSAGEAACEGAGLKVASGLSVLSVSEVGEALQRLGLKDSVVDSFMNENIDGDLLSKFDEATLQDTFPSLRSIDLRKVCLFIQSGWQPHV